MLLSRLAAALVLIGSVAAHASAQNLAIKGGRVHLGTGASIENGIVIIRDGKIAAVGKAADVPVPDGVRVLEAAVVTPGLVDVRGTLGVSGLYNTKHDSDQIENSAPMQPELRAIDAYNPQDRLVPYARSYGITTANTGNAPGQLISGQTLAVKTVGNTVDAALVRSPTLIVANLGPAALESGGKSPGTRGKQVAMLREELIKAREYRDRRAKAAAKPAPGVESDAGGSDDKSSSRAPDRNLRLEALADVLDQKVPLAITANRAQDIESALRLAEEFGFRLVLDMAAEAYLLTDKIKAANEGRGADVLLHPSMYRAVGETENQSFETAAVLRKAGIRFAIQSGYEAYVPKTRIVLFEAAIAAAHGLTFEEALSSITLDAARILGIEQRVGSLEVGKDGDVALYSGDPFEYTTRCVGVVIEGRVVSEEPS